MDSLYYFIAYFCPPLASLKARPYWADLYCQDKEEFELFLVNEIDGKDVKEIEEIKTFKEINPDFKLDIAVGGWNQPSAMFSEMANNEEYRSKFVKATKKLIDDYGFDGMDLDWEFPCSVPKEVEMIEFCEVVHVIVDEGGNCPEDKINFTILMKELREALGDDKTISVASYALFPHAEKSYEIEVAIKYIDMWNLMSYDYNGGWSGTSGANSKLYGDGFNIDAAV